MHSLLQSVTPKEFERFSAALLELEKFTNIRWVGAEGADKARDILAEKTVEPVDGRQETQRWVVQCKRYSAKRIGKQELHSLFAAAEEHHPHNLLVIYTGTLGASVQDWMEAVAPKFSFRIYVWQATDLDRLMQRHYTKLATRFPKYLCKRGSLWLYHVDFPDEHEFICHEFDELSIKVINSGSFKLARKRVLEFIEHIKADKIVLCGKPAPRYVEDEDV